MVPVGRMTLVRTFSKSGLLRAMSFVSIPALVAPMLGPIAGGLIVGYLHWRFIFFVNIPIGLAGLVLVYAGGVVYAAGGLLGPCKDA
jgi:MFS family permease